MSGDFLPKRMIEVRVAEAGSLLVSFDCDSLSEECREKTKQELFQISTLRLTLEGR